MKKLYEKNELGLADRGPRGAVLKRELPHP